MEKVMCPKCMTESTMDDFETWKCPNCSQRWAALVVNKEKGP